MPSFNSDNIIKTPLKVREDVMSYRERFKHCPRQIHKDSSDSDDSLARTFAGNCLVMSDQEVERQVMDEILMSSNRVNLAELMRLRAEYIDQIGVSKSSNCSSDEAIAQANP